MLLAKSASDFHKNCVTHHVIGIYLHYERNERGTRNVQPQTANDYADKLANNYANCLTQCVLAVSTVCQSALKCKSEVSEPQLVWSSELLSKKKLP